MCCELICCEDEGCWNKYELFSCEWICDWFCSCWFSTEGSLDEGPCNQYCCASVESGDCCLCEDDEGVDRCCSCCEGCGPCLAQTVAGCFMIGCCCIVGFKRERRKKLTGMTFKAQVIEERNNARILWDHKRTARDQRKKMEREKKKAFRNGGGGGQKPPPVPATMENNNNNQQQYFSPQHVEVATPSHN